MLRTTNQRHLKTGLEGLWLSLHVVLRRKSLKLQAQLYSSRLEKVLTLEKESKVGLINGMEALPFGLKLK